VLEPIVYIDQWYDDDLDEPQPWPRLRKWPGDTHDWSAVCDTSEPADVERALFADVEDAIAWGRARAHTVLVRLGSTEDTYYSAGEAHAHEYVDGSGRAYLTWPPDKWPEYAGPDGETRSY
jgi:hypothetical protein